MKTANIATVVLASLGLASLAGAATTDTSTTATTAHHRGPMMHRDGFGEDGFMAALHRLNLTAEQKQTIKTIMSNSRAQSKSQASTIDFAALNNPGDPNYAQAVRNAQNLAMQRIEQRSNIDQQIYNVLTTEQKAQLPTVLADMKAKAGQQRNDWRQKNNQSNSAGSSG